MNGLFVNSLKSPYEVFCEEGILFFPKLFEGEQLERLRAACEYVLAGFNDYVDKNNEGLRNSTSMRWLEEPIWHPDPSNQQHRMAIMEAAADPRCVGAAEQIFRGESLYRTSSLFMNPRFTSHEGNWHRDTQFVEPDEDAVRARIARGGMDGLQMQIALVDTEDIEYVPFSPGRYDAPEEYHYRIADNETHSREQGMPNAMRIHQRPGDAVVFNANGLHRGRYYVENPRRTLMFTYTVAAVPCRDDFSWTPWMLDPSYLEGVSPRARTYYQSYIDTYREFWHTETRYQNFR